MECSLFKNVYCFIQRGAFKKYINAFYTLIVQAFLVVYSGESELCRTNLYAVNH